MKPAISTASENWYNGWSMLPQIKAEVDPDDELNSLVQQIAGTDKAEEAKRFLRYLISTPS